MLRDAGGRWTVNRSFDDKLFAGCRIFDGASRIFLYENLDQVDAVRLGYKIALKINIVDHLTINNRLIELLI